MGALVSYQIDSSIAAITMDDGKVNALSPQLFAELAAAFDQAAADRAVVLLTGRPGVFSAGFDLSVLSSGGPAAISMVRAGFELAVRMLSFATPVVIACPGHAVAMGAFLLLSGDYRIGAAGPYRITLNEVAIGMTIPRVAVEICRQRLTPAYLSRAVALAEVFTPDAAVAAGFLDRAVADDELAEAARSTAAGLARLDMAAHAASKRNVRAHALAAIRDAMDTDAAGLRLSPPRERAGS